MLKTNLCQKRQFYFGYSFDPLFKLRPMYLPYPNPGQKLYAIFYLNSYCSAGPRIPTIFVIKRISLNYYQNRAGPTIVLLKPRISLYRVSLCGGFAVKRKIYECSGRKSSLESLKISEAPENLTSLSMTQYTYATLEFLILIP